MNQTDVVVMLHHLAAGLGLLDWYWMRDMPSLCMASSQVAAIDIQMPSGIHRQIKRIVCFLFCLGVTCPLSWWWSILLWSLTGKKTYWSTTSIILRRFYHGIYRCHGHPWGTCYVHHSRSLSVFGGQNRIPAVPKCVFPRDSLGLFCIWLIWCL